MPTPPYFPERTGRPFLADVASSFPFPLALTYARLHAAMDQQQPVEAAWALRDAVECTIKFAGCLAVADFLSHQPEPQRASQVAEVLLTDRGLPIGAWLELLRLTLEPLQGHPHHRALPLLFAVFFEPGRPRLSKSAVLRSLDGDQDSFIAWRNSVFGHGVFRQERSWYAGQTLAWLPRLHTFLEAMRPVLAGWQLLARTADGQEVDWQGCDFEPLHQRHQHHPAGLPLPLELVQEQGSRLALAPLLSVQRCAVCQEPAAFFFDRQKDEKKTIFLEYLRGHHGEQKGWMEVARLWALRPAAFVWRRQIYDTAEVVEGVPICFREFAQEYLRPAYLLDALWRWVRDHVRGYVLLRGQAGVGKSYLVRGLAELEQTGGVPVVRYHIRAGRRTECQLFAIELNDQVKEKLGCKTVDLQLKSGTSPEALQKEFVDYLKAVKQHTGFETLLIALDGLDELPEAEPSEPLVTDLLPEAVALPEGCFVVLLTRPEVRPRVQARLDALRRAGSDVWQERLIDPGSAGNEKLLQAYLERALPVAFRSPGVIAEVVQRSRGVFLYAAHHARALETGVFSDTTKLPAGEVFYPVYLARLREQVGPELYQTVYLPLLLYLTAAFEPVTREQLETWGLPSDRLRVALNDLRDFVLVVRTRLWHEGLNESGEQRYELAHEDFERFLQGDAGLSELLRGCHERIAARALERGRGQWEAFDPADDADLYDLRFVVRHAQYARRTDWIEEVGRSEEYARGCWRVANLLNEKARHHLAVELCGRMEEVYRRLVEREGRRELAGDLAGAWMNRSVSLRELGRLVEAESDCDQAIATFRQLVEEQGRCEQAEDLARALINRGPVLRLLGRLEEAIETYDEAIAILQQPIEHEGRGEQFGSLAKALMNRAQTLSQLGRLEESVATCNQAIAILRGLVQQGGRHELAGTLSSALSNQGSTLRHLGRLEESVATCNQAISILRGLVRQEGRRELVTNLTNALGNQGIALRHLGRMMEAVAAYDEAIAILRGLVEQEGRRELAGDLASTLMNRGVALTQLGRLEEAVTAYDEVIAIRRRLVQREGRRELADDLASTLMNRGVALRHLGRLEEAVTAYDEVIAIRRRLVRQEGRRDLVNSLAGTLMNQGNALAQLDRLDEAVVAYNEAIPLHRGLVEQEGRRELANNLALTLMNQGLALSLLGRLEESVAACDEAIVLIRRLVEQEKRHELVGEFARVQAVKASVLLRLGERERAADLARQAMTVLRAEIERTGRADYQRCLTFADNVLRKAELDPDP
jgi:tetratricopeptide (TPR) repeat protein